MATTGIDYQARIRKALAKVGTTNGSAPPECKVPKGMGNQKEVYTEQFNALVNYIRASTICSIADKMKNDAKTELVKLGMLGDFDKLAPGDYTTIDNGQMLVMVKVNNDSEGYDQQMLINQLALKVSPQELKKILDKCRKDKKGARTITATLRD